MAKTSGGLLAKQQEQKQVATQQKSLAVMMNDLLEKQGVRNRINELLGKRAPQFVGSLVSLVNANSAMQAVFRDAPVTIIQSALRAATYDLPIDSSLGYAYILPFKNKQENGSYRNEAQFILGYKGMYQLAMRTGVYKKLNVTDVRQGELKSYNRLTEDIEIEFIENEEERNQLPIIGYCGYFRLVNGMEKTIYMTVQAIEAHELANRKGKYMGKGWRDNKDAMCRKTVLRQLIGKWGIMSIDYQTASPAVIEAAEHIAKNGFDDEDTPTFDVGAETITDEQGRTIDPDTGEILDADFSAEEVEASVGE